MGFLSDLFGGEEKLPDPVIKETPWGPEARTFLQNLFRQTPQIPTRQVAGLTGNEQAGQSLLGSFIAGDELRDPRTDPFYLGLRQESEREEDRTVSALRRRSQLGGAFSSSGALREEGDARGAFANQRLTLLGSLLNQERERNDPLKRIGAASEFGGAERAIEQARFDATYQQTLEQLLFPFQTQAPIATQVLAYQPWYQPQTAYRPGPLSGQAEGVATGLGAGLGGGFGRILGGLFS